VGSAFAAAAIARKIKGAATLRAAAGNETLNIGMTPQ
jgi:hypothetical protein